MKEEMEEEVEETVRQLESDHVQERATMHSRLEQRHASERRDVESKHARSLEEHREAAAAARVAEKAMAEATRKMKVQVVELGQRLESGEQVGLERIAILNFTSITTNPYKGSGLVYRVICGTYRAQTSTTVGSDT